MKYAKAIIGAIVAGLTAILTALPDGLTTAEWLTAAIATLTVAGGVYIAPKNREPNEDGVASLEFVVGILVGLAIALLLPPLFR